MLDRMFIKAVTSTDFFSAGSKSCYLEGVQRIQWRGADMENGGQITQSRPSHCCPLLMRDMMLIFSSASSLDFGATPVPSP